MTVLEEITPGALFTATDGNRNTLDDARFPLPGEPTDFVLDAEGNEVRTGDFVLVLESNWPEFNGKIARVTSAKRGMLYGGGGYLIRREEGKVVHAWSPSSPLNGVGIQRNLSSTGARASAVRKVNLTPEDTLRLELSEMYDERSRIDALAAKLEGERTVLGVRIREHRRALGEID